MKPTTFADLIVSQGDELLKGFKSSADNEKYAQVIIDRAIKSRWGASLEHQSMGGTKIREIAYPNAQSKGQQADFAVLYTRPPKQDEANPFKVTNFVDKQTAYFIEVKTESGGNIGHFSGMSWKAAFQSDIDKLGPISSWISYASLVDQSKGYQKTRGRCFAVLISFCPETSGKIISKYQTEFPNSVCRAGMLGQYQFCVLVQEV
jgi:hypothetical protein